MFLSFSWSFVHCWVVDEVWEIKGLQPFFEADGVVLRRSTFTLLHVWRFLGTTFHECSTSKITIPTKTGLRWNCRQLLGSFKHSLCLPPFRNFLGNYCWSLTCLCCSRITLGTAFGILQGTGCDNIVTVICRWCLKVFL